MTNQELAELDLAVAKALGYESMLVGQMEAVGLNLPLPSKNIKHCWILVGEAPEKFQPSTNGDQGVAIIEDIGGFELKIWLESTEETRCEAHIHNYDGDWIAFGPTTLIAAMKAFVASQEEK